MFGPSGSLVCVMPKTPKSAWLHGFVLLAACSIYFWRSLSDRFEVESQDALHLSDSLRVLEGRGVDRG